MILLAQFFGDGWVDALVAEEGDDWVAGHSEHHEVDEKRGAEEHRHSLQHSFD